MSKSHIQLHPNAKSKHVDSKQNLKKLDKFAQKYSWLIIGVFAVSTVVSLGLVVNDIRGNVGQAALDIAGYNLWKTTYGLNSNSNDANWNLSGDGITNYNKYTLNQSLALAFDGSVIPEAVTNNNQNGTDTSTQTLPNVGGSTTVATRTIDATAPSISTNATSTTTSSSTVPAVGSSTSLTASTLNPNGPALSNPTPSTGTNTSTGTSETTTGATLASTGTSTVTNPTGTGGSTAIPLPIPGSGSGSNGIVASTVNTSNNSATTGTSTSTNTSTTQNNGTVNTSGTSVNPNLNLTAGATSATGVKTETVRTGGETNFIIFTAALISLFTGIYLLKNKFTKNSLAVHQGEKSGKS
jgi:hypothetical protein